MGSVEPVAWLVRAIDAVTATWGECEHADEINTVLSEYAHRFARIPDQPTTAHAGEPVALDTPARRRAIQIDTVSEADLRAMPLQVAMAIRALRRHGAPVEAPRRTYTDDATIYNWIKAGCPPSQPEEDDPDSEWCRTVGDVLDQDPRYVIKVCENLGPGRLEALRKWANEP